MNDEGWWFQAVDLLCWHTDGQKNKQTYICDCRVAFATEKTYNKGFLNWEILAPNGVSRNFPFYVINPLLWKFLTLSVFNSNISILCTTLLDLLEIFS